MIYLLGVAGIVWLVRDIDKRSQKKQASELKGKEPDSLEDDQIYGGKDRYL